ncbi:LysR substrate-binding domain-containing protein [Trinickia fusca]|uniref:LysR family transcriptional regulator n=1 Tax=Trinickia fusca TaxID=2419777 RepID=A0A494X9L0_9BURK|nr:LysR substrate-binding domain-containing protein [Trinickia fusca]RKP47457.1 LysR family transcriptional regulator [Trinickia fusca]
MKDLLDLDAVRAFVQVADLCSFTRAADALATTQSAVSLKIKRLEAHLDKALLERTPRSVRLSAAGQAFLGAARELLHAHERAVTSVGTERRRLKLGLSEHVAGPDLTLLLNSMHRHDPQLVVEMHLGSSTSLLARYDERQFDAVIVRNESDQGSAPSMRNDAVTLFTEPLAWLAAPDWVPPAGEPLPLAVLAAPCGVRSLAIRALDAADIPWQETFVGGGMAAVGAALEAGLAVSALARRVVPATLVDVGARLGLPALPASQVVMYSRVREPRSAASLRALAAALGRH